MLIPSIDIMNGRAVQLEGGDPDRLRVDAGDPRAVAERFAVAGEIAVIDLDAALGRGTNEEVIRDLLRDYDCRVGGGIRSVDAARAWLDAGASKVILGTAARVEVLRELPAERVLAALDARDGDVVVDGWRERTGAQVVDRVNELRELVAGFLVTFVEREGRMAGTDLERARAIVAAAGDRRVTIAGGVTTADEIRTLDEIGADAQVGMAIYTGALDLGDAIAAVMVSDRPDGLLPTLVCDERGVALGLAYSSPESLRIAVRDRRGVYFSRSRGGVWRKGETSGATQTLRRIDVDCDRDTLRFTVNQAGGGFCHVGTRTCFGDDTGLGRLSRRLAAPASDREAASYTSRLLADPKLLAGKLREEAAELAAAETPDEVVNEAADVMYFTLARLAAAGVGLGEVEQELERRSRKVGRRPGNAKPPIPDEAETLATAGRILEDVCAGGLEAARAHATRLGDLAPDGRIIYDRGALRAALDAIAPGDRALLERAAERIDAFARAQRESLDTATVQVPGGEAGHGIAPVERAGCYAPGGRFPLPSSVLMTAVTARVAGVGEVWVASPRPAPVTLAAAAIAGADGLLAIGGAQAIGVLAYGGGDVPACDVIVGPGNRWVTAAKQLIAGKIRIDGLAGPSELLIIADATADPATVAADMLAQAEHDTDARASLVSLDAALIGRVREELERQLADLPTATIAREALANGFMTVAASVDEAVAISDRHAPEHLQVMTADATDVAARCGAYGGIFIGSSAAEVLGDYGIGPNHTLPTGGTARSFGGLSVFDFLRVRTWLRVDDAGAARAVIEDTVRLARLEGLEGHARSAERRLSCHAKAI